MTIQSLFITVLLCNITLASATTPLLPPIANWHGSSEKLIRSSDDAWQTPAERSGLTDTPNYADTMAYLNRLVASDKRLQLQVIGHSPQGRDIVMVIASANGASTAGQLAANGQPTLLAQAGIHAGEIDGKDAGLMLLRDIVHGDKGPLLDHANWLFIPILSVDAHERRSSYNRVNQRGPTHMGWRTNSQNLNLNRDYTKLDTPELRSVIGVINRWQPDLYFDIHVTDGEDYQYDITYGFSGDFTDSPHISHWLAGNLRPSVDKALKAQGHLGGPLIFGLDSLDFGKGLDGWTPPPRYSDGYGSVRHLPTVLVENHSLKPYKRRVLGTYILLEQSLKTLGQKGQSLRQAIVNDRARRPKTQTLSWLANPADTHYINFAGMAYNKATDPQTGIHYVEWTGQPKTYHHLPLVPHNKPGVQVSVPRAYIIPVQYQHVIRILQLQGIAMKPLPQSRTMAVTQLIAHNVKLAHNSFEGHQRANAEFTAEKVTLTLPKGSMQISSDQPLGALAVAMLDPRGPDSLFSWGFFNSITQRTEYIESYALVPLIKQMINAQPALFEEFKQKKATDKAFAADQQAQMRWFYSRSPYYDNHYLHYPVVMVE